MTITVNIVSMIIITILVKIVNRVIVEITEGKFVRGVRISKLCYVSYYRQLHLILL